MFGNVIQCNPIANSDPNGDYSKVGAFARSFWYGDGKIAQDKRTGEWGYIPKYGNRYKYFDPPQKKQDGNRSAVRNSRPPKAGVNAAKWFIINLYEYSSIG